MQLFTEAYEGDADKAFFAFFQGYYRQEIERNNCFGITIF